MRNCENCRKKGLFRKTGQWVKVGGIQRREMICRCGHRQLEEPPQNEVVKPKVLYFDIETSTTQIKLDVFSMRVRSGWLDWHDIEKSFFVLCWSAAWVYEDELKIMSDVVTPWEAVHRRDKRCLQRLWELMDRADYVVGHNSDGFDIKMVETRFMLNHMGTPSLYKTKDTLRTAKNRFRAESNALAYWSRLLGGDGKDPMTKEDWIECKKGDQKALNKMRHYNKGDVREGVNVLKQFVSHVESNKQYKVFR